MKIYRFLLSYRFFLFATLLFFFLLLYCGLYLPQYHGSLAASGQFGDTFGLASCVINGFGFLAVVFELTRSAGAERAKSKRERAESTIFAFRDANSVITRGEMRMRKLLADHNNTLTSNDIAALSNDQQTYSDIWDALDSLHFLAVGIRTKVFDIYVAAHLYGAWFSHVVRLFEPLIDYSQSLQPRERQFFYEDTRKIAEQLLLLQETRIRNGELFEYDV